MMAAGAEEPEAPQRRVVVADARGDGHFLRVTWHPELGQFVVSQWRDDTCVASTRLAPDAASEVLALLVRGLAGGQSAPR
jgi:hypothetical protein